MRRARTWGGGLFGRRRKQAEAEGARLTEELTRAEERIRALHQEQQYLTEQLERILGADAAQVAAERERLRREHEERRQEIGRIDALLDAKVERASERAARLVGDIRQRAEPTTPYAA